MSHREVRDMHASTTSLAVSVFFPEQLSAGAVYVIFQGILVAIVSIVLYGRAVTLPGASGGAAFGALVPALSALFAIPLLREWPGEAD